MTSQPRPRKAASAAQASARAMAQMAAGVPVGAPLRIDWPDGSTEPATLVAVVYDGAKCCVSRPRAPWESRYPAPEHLDVPVRWCRFQARRRFTPAAPASGPAAAAREEEDANA